MLQVKIISENFMLIYRHIQTGILQGVILRKSKKFPKLTASSYIHNFGFILPRRGKEMNAAYHLSTCCTDTQLQQKSSGT
jgi:hypothetical protein